MRGCRSSHGKEQGPLVHLVSLPLLKNSLLVQLDQTGQVLVAVANDRYEHLTRLVELYK